MSTPLRITVAALHGFVADTFAALGMPRADAEIQAEALVNADLCDMHTYGVVCMPAYADFLAEGHINPRPDIRMEPRGAWAWACDGDNGMGQLVATRAMNTAVSTAEETGIGMVAVRRSNHFGAARLYPVLALKKNFIGIVMATSSPAVAPWGGREKLLGTNPLAVAVPAGRHPPFVADMALASVGRLKIREAAQKGLSIPADWAFDSQGKPATDPAAALSGSLAPMGGAKGFALITLVDILAGVLTGAQFGGGVLSFLTNIDREADGGNLAIALRDRPECRGFHAVRRLQPPNGHAHRQHQEDARRRGRRREERKSRSRSKAIGRFARLGRRCQTFRARRNAGRPFSRAEPIIA